MDRDFALCGSCWRDIPFITGLVCECCGAPVPGVAGAGAVQCDDCLATPRPWVAGRAAVLYRDRARKLVLGLKHGHRTDIARPAALWMVQAGRPVLRPDAVLAPIPLHWSRLVRRSFNQSALLADLIARHTGLPHLPDLLHRVRHTPSLDHKTAAARVAALSGSMVVQRRHVPRIASRPVVLIDDVMTSGATLAEATRACQAAGSGPVFVLTLARVTKDA